MIRQTVLPFKLERTDEALTAHGGLALLAEYNHGLGLRTLTDHHLPGPGSHRGYAPSVVVDTLVLLLQAGGQTLEDLRALEREAALLALLGHEVLPDPDTVGDWLRRMGDPQTGQAGLVGLGQVRDALTARLLRRDRVTDYTLDVDATLIAAEKRDAQWSYQGVKGYMPLLGFLFETPVCLVDEFREGNVSPGAGHLAFYRACHARLPEGKRIAAYRADSASYQAELINALEADGVRWAITADQDAAVKGLIRGLDPEAWHEPVPGCGYEVAETVHTMNKSTHAFRLIVKRTRRRQPDLFDGEIYAYHAVASNWPTEDKTAHEVLGWHNQRGQAENFHKELKCGFGLERLPCGETPFIDVVPDSAGDMLRIESDASGLPRPWQRFVMSDGRLNGEPEDTLDALRNAHIPNLRISQEVAPWLQAKRHLKERKALLREYEQKVQSGEWPAQETRIPLFPYQREGMLHLAFNERALLADEMGLGKTIQAVAACALLRRVGKVSRVLVVTPASLKTEWEEQIQRYTELPFRLVFGPRQRRLACYSSPAFFTIVNYEQVIRDGLDINQQLTPDVVILDEAQHIKNWATKTAQAIKCLRSRYAFVLTGTPIENRIDDLYSLMDFLNPEILGPLFRFNREFYKLDNRGRPTGYRNLVQLHARVTPLMMRRRKADVEAELPERTERTFFVPLSPEQKHRYDDHEAQVARLAGIARRRPLTQQESEKLQRELAMMRMVCDTNYILDPTQRACPKLGELEKILEECRDTPDVKALVFSEWERMLELAQGVCESVGLAYYALHTGSVPQRRRRAEILRFKHDAQCRVFLSTDSGSTGLNLQNASVIINCDLPWNPARLEQRIARAWRKHQTRSVTVIHLVSEGTLEHRMLDTLSAKQALADGVLEIRGDLTQIRLRGGRAAFLARLEQLLRPGTSESSAPSSHRQQASPVDRVQAFAQRAREQLGATLLRCEARYPAADSPVVLVVVVDQDVPRWRAQLVAIHQELCGPPDVDPSAITRLEVIDRATDEALRRLTEAGLIASSTRAIRVLYSADDAGSAARPLSAAERDEALGHRRQAARKLKMSRLLMGGELHEEARDALLEAAFWVGKALAVEHRLLVPAKLEDAFQPPLALYWGDHLSALQALASHDSVAPAPVADILQEILHVHRGETPMS